MIFGLIRLVPGGAVTMRMGQEGSMRPEVQQTLRRMFGLAETPLPPDSPYFDLPNVMMTPNMAGINQSAYQRITDLFCENLRRYLAVRNC